MKSVLQYPHLGILILAWFVADMILPILIRLGHRTGILDQPGGHKAQQRPTPFFGGIGVFTAFTIAVCSTLRFQDHESFLPLVGLLVGGAILVTLGLIDDHIPVNAVVKLLVLALTTLLIANFGIRLQLFPELLWNLPDTVITLLWIVGVTSAMNSVDNTDGVAPGLTAIACVFTFIIAWGTSATDAQPWLSYLALALLGSCLGMLRYNLPPARIYLGDNGSFFLGFMLSAMMVFAHFSTSPIRAILIPACILSVPIFDIVLATVLRIRQKDVRTVKEAILFCGRDHTAHLIMALGFDKRQTVCIIYGLAVCGGIAALLIRAAPQDSLAITVACMYGILLAGVGAVLAQARRRLQHAGRPTAQSVSTAHRMRARSGAAPY